METGEFEVQKLAKQLIEAVETVMNISVDRHQRILAHKFCEEFKDNSPHCVACGLYLASIGNPPIARNFGFQLVEHCIKYRWNNLTLAEKIYIKDSAMKLLGSGTEDILSEQIYIKNSLSKLIVEMIKREWPQHWPSLLNELHILCSMGETQTELVLLIFLRLVEDIVTFQNVAQQRRREIYQALTMNMNDIFNFFLELLHSHTDKFTLLETSNLYRPFSRKIPVDQRIEVVEKAISNDILKQLIIEIKQTNSTIEMNTYLSDGKDETTHIKALAHCRVAQAALETLAAFVEWVPVTHIMANNGLLLQTLCILLSNESLQLPAAECLLQIVNRKGKSEDRKPLLVLFNQEPMEAIFKAACASANAPLEARRYVFLKRLCQILTGIGSQLCALWGTVEDVDQPPNLKTYLEAILAFTQHPSQMLSSYTYQLWTSFFRHHTISHNSVVKQFVPSVIKATKQKLIKVGYPSRNDGVSCDYARLEFDSDEEFNQFFPKFRTDVAETLRLATAISPTFAFEHAADCLTELLGKRIDVGEGTDSALCTLASPSYLEWDALSVCLESIFGKILMSEEPRPSAEDGIRLLEAVLNYETEDPLILSCTLSCISALFTFLTLAPEKLTAVLNKIFSTLVFSLPGQTKATRSRTVKNVRRHACSALVRICKQYPLLLLPSFDVIYMHVQKLSSDPEELSQMEKCTLLEALILISNQFQDFGRQSNFIGEIILPVSSVWLAQEIKEAVSDVESFMAYIGLNKPPVEPSNNDIVGINRSQIIFCVNTMLAVIKRSKWPDDLDAAKKGMFIRGDVSSGNYTLHNPATIHVRPLFEHLFMLLKSFNELWLPNALKNVYPEYTPAYEILEADKNNILGVCRRDLCMLAFGDQQRFVSARGSVSHVDVLHGRMEELTVCGFLPKGINPPCVDMTDPPNFRQPVERMKHFLSNVHDTCYHILGNAGPCLGHEFYEMPGLAEFISSCAFHNLDLIPDYRLRPIIQVFMKPFIQFCPPDFYISVMIPVLIKLCPYMLERLSKKWDQLKQLAERSSPGDEENAESQEILEEQLNRQLSREYIDMLVASCFGKRNTNDVNDMMEEDIDNCPTNPQPISLGELGQLMLKHEKLSEAIVLCCFQALSWNDTTTCIKSFQICGPIIKQLIVNNSIGMEEACFLLNQILKGLALHGQHEASQSCLVNLALSAYESLRPLFPEVINVMMQIPGCTLQTIENFDEKILQSINSRNLFSEKKKKEMFKKIVLNVVGPSVSQWYKKSVEIKNLPPVFKMKKPSSSTIDESKDLGLCKLFEGPSATSQ